MMDPPPFDSPADGAERLYAALADIGDLVAAMPSLQELYTGVVRILERHVGAWLSPVLTPAGAISGTFAVGMIAASIGMAVPSPATAARSGPAAAFAVPTPGSASGLFPFPFAAPSGVANGLGVSSSLTPRSAPASGSTGAVTRGPGSVEPAGPGGPTPSGGEASPGVLGSLSAGTGQVGGALSGAAQAVTTSVGAAADALSGATTSLSTGAGSVGGALGSVAG